jgi:sugar transferase (PEP-CTERM/EpsH1 system associated)
LLKQARASIALTRAFGMRIFFVCQRVPYPPNRGDKITTFNEIKHLANKHEVHVFCLADRGEESANVEGVRRHAASATVVAFSSRSSWFRALRALLSGDCMSVAAFDVSRMHEAIRERHRELAPELVIVHSSTVAQYAEHFDGTSRIMQFTDLDSLKWQQYADRAHWSVSWIYRIEHRRLLAYERHIASTFTRSVVCTQAERTDFQRLIPGISVDVVANGVDLDYFAPQGREKQAGRLIFTGVMDYSPNVDAVRWFAHEILPLVRRAVPHATFVICGSRPTSRVLALASLRGVTVTGGVPDTRPFMDAAEVSVVPLRMARGIQNKVLEALAMGLPCVASVAAWSGTVIPSGEGIVPTDDPAEFAHEIVRLLQDNEYRHEMGLRARGSAKVHYAWSAHLEHLDQVIEQATDSRLRERVIAS